MGTHACNERPFQPLDEGRERPMRKHAQKKDVCEISDGILVQHTLAGDEEAYAVLVQRYSSSLFHWIYRFLRDADAAGDTLQEVFLQLYLSLPQLRIDAPLKPWLFHVARNRCLETLRRKKAIPFSSLKSITPDDGPSPWEIIPDPHPLAEEIAEQHEMQRLVQQAIATLPSKYRLIVLLRSVAQLTFPEIGQALHIPAATARTYFQRSKPLLRAVLAEQDRPCVPSPAMQVDRGTTV